MVKSAAGCSTNLRKCRRNGQQIACTLPEHTCLYTCLYMCIHLSIHMSTYLSIHMSAHLSIHMSTHICPQKSTHLVARAEMDNRCNTITACDGQMLVALAHGNIVDLFMATRFGGAERPGAKGRHHGAQTTGQGPRSRTIGGLSILFGSAELWEA